MSPVTPIEATQGKTCGQCGGPATHAYGNVWLCCDCHAGPGEGLRPKTPEQWAALLDSLYGLMGIMGAQLEIDAERFEGFARHCRDSGWDNLGAEFDGFARDTREAIARAKGGAS